MSKEELCPKKEHVTPDPEQVAVSLECLVTKLESCLLHLLSSQSYLDCRTDVPIRSEEDVSMEPWELTTSSGDFEVMEPVVSQEYVSSLLRESLEPILTDFDNNNSSSGAVAMDYSPAVPGQSSKAVSFSRPNQFNNPARARQVSSYLALGESNAVQSKLNSGSNGASVAADLNPSSHLSTSVSFTITTSQNRISSTGHLVNHAASNATCSIETVESLSVKVRIQNSVARIQHWAENCPYSQFRDRFKEFLTSLSQVRFNLFKLFCSVHKLALISFRVVSFPWTSATCCMCTRRQSIFPK